MTHAFNQGDVVQLRSGGPLMTVSKNSGGFVYVIYYNTITGLFEQFFTTEASLKSANTTPEVPRAPGTRPRSSLS